MPALPEDRLARVLKLWRAEAATYQFSTSISTTLVQAYAIRVLHFDVDLLGLLVFLQIGSVSLGYLVGSVLVATLRKRRILLWKVPGALNRVLWATVGFSHLLPERVRVGYLLASVATAQFAGSVAGIAAGDVGADLVSRERAVRFYSSLNSIALLANCLGLATATALFYIVPVHSATEAYTVAYGTALASSITSTALLATLEDLNPPSSSTGVTETLREFARVSRDSDCSSYVGLVALFAAVVNLPGALWNYYLLTVFRGSESWITLKAVTANLSQAVGYRLWGEILRRVGTRRGLYVGIALTSPIPVAFILAPTLWSQLAVEVYSGFVWAAYNLANNIYTLYLPRRESRVYFIALLNLASNAVASVTSRLGASIASLGLQPMNAVFIASTVGRVVSSVVARARAPRLV
ncbi:MAG: hypothetical protein LM571_02950 [Desulfurococcaceae archaeon]|nr:hypothetical protein [Desulfurococcaceae archaeon]